MTDQTPATEAGRRLAARWESASRHDDSAADILAIEAEARAALDVERLARAEHASYDRDPTLKRIEWDDLTDYDKAMWRRHAKRHATEYARLSEREPGGGA